MIGKYRTYTYKISGIPYVIKIGLIAVVLTYTKTVKSSVAPKNHFMLYMADNVVIIIKCSSEKRKHCCPFIPFALVMKRCSLKDKSLKLTSSKFFVCIIHPDHGRIYREANEDSDSGPLICTGPFQEPGRTLNKYSLFVPNFIFFFLKMAPKIV